MDHDTTSQSPDNKQKFFYGYIIVLIAFIVLAINNGSRASFGVFLKPILTDLGSTRGLISGVFSVARLVNAFVTIPVGRLVDKFGPRAAVTFCGLFAGLGYLLMFQTTAVWQMYLFYGVFIGIGSAIYTPLMATVVRWFTTRRNVMLGIVGTGISIGTMIIPVFASWLISVYDWRISFVILGGIIIIVVIVSAQFLKKEPDRSEQQAHGEDTKKRTGSQLPSNDSSLKEALMNVQFWLLTLLNFAFGFIVATLTVHTVPYATDQGISATSAASILSVFGGVGIASRLLMGSIADRFGENRSILLSFIFVLASVIWLMSAKELWMFYLFAIGFALSSGVGTQITPWLAKIFGLTSIGSIAAASGIGHLIGFALGPSMAGFIFDNTQSYHWAFMSIAIMTFIAIVVTIILSSTGIKQKPS